MTARDRILSAVRTSLPFAAPLPDVRGAIAAFADTNAVASDERASQMMRVARNGGSTVIESVRSELQRCVQRAHPSAKLVLSMVNEVQGNCWFPANLRELESLDVFVCEGVLGVAQDGAVWLPTSALGHRAALFLAAHVVLVLRRSAIVGTLHDAYQALDTVAEEFGVFVAGPSKTADIEQSLVIGAHGPKSLTLVVVHE